MRHEERLGNLEIELDAGLRGSPIAHHGEHGAGPESWMNDPGAAGELEGRLAVISKAQGRSTTQLRQGLAQGGQLEGVRRQMRREKTIDQLLGTDAAPEEE